MKLDTIRILNYAAIVVTLAWMVMMFGCMSAPKSIDYKGRPAACFDFDRCLYYNQKNQDKSVCIDYAKECRAVTRFEYCRDVNNRPAGMDFNNCWLYLNQK